MEQKVREFNEAVDELMELVKSKLIAESFEEMDADEFKAMQLCFKLVNSSKNILTENAKIMDEQNRKLDLLFERSEKD